jgi:Fe2+ transport system protein FeoA
MALTDLTQMRIGQNGTIVEIQGGFGLRNRLQSMGVRPGKKITKVSGFFMRGPITVSIENMEVALGFGMGKKVIVEVVEQEQR